MAALGAFLAVVSVVATRSPRGASPVATSPTAATVSARPTSAVTPALGSLQPGLQLIVRTPQHLQRASDVTPLVERLAARHVTRAFVLMKQDETDEFAAGTAFFPSRVAPVADGFDDGRLAALIERMAARGIEPMAWMPVLHDARAATAHPEWRSRRVTATGSLAVDDGWLCPFDPRVARYQAAIASEIAVRFPDLGGLYLDFIRYDDDLSCVGPRSLAELEKRSGWRSRIGRPLRPLDLRRASETQSRLWTEWTALRAEKIVATVNTIRDAVEEVRPNFRIGAFVLPFSTRAYEQDTQAGQDLRRMARAGLDEIVVMGYWDDWGRSPAWVREGLEDASRLTGDEVELSVALDGDQGVRRTRLTLEALGPWADKASWFNYTPWSVHELERLTRAIDGHRAEGPMPRPDYVSVVIRIDTEPNNEASYEDVDPGMIDTVAAALAAEDVNATFITVGRLAELQTEAIRRLAAAGHEIGSHSYDHEQLDALAIDDQIAAVDRGLTSLVDLGFDVRGFGAPRNSGTDETRDRLMDWNLEYDGSDAYDPMTGFLDVRYEARSTGASNRIVVVPFVIPNDYDARWAGTMTAAEMAEAWKIRLDRVIESGEPVFVLDVHQWAISIPENLAALRAFIRYAKACSVCRVETLRQAAGHARAVLDRYELPAPTSGDVPRVGTGAISGSGS